MTLLEEYVDVLRTMQLAVAMEYHEKGKKAKPVRRLGACCKAILKRVKYEEVRQIVVGIYYQPYPPAALQKTVREYEALEARIDYETRKKLGVAQ
ncbi:MAG: hypothetical protein ACRDCE_19630 [Cetobacterium sp.]|uniref:DUF7740 domain-containing protein n=1 Tax=Cetobacterium sp. TaxID=2071632 RepID=UPI003EE4C7C9